MIVATIVVDPGHGGTTDEDCSNANHARGPVHGLLEKHLTLDVALRVKREIERRGGHVVALTRESDVNFAAAARAQRARNLNADVFVSIHFNASNRHDAQGTETWVHSRASNTGETANLCRALQAGVLRATGLSDRNRHHPPHFIKKADFCVINPSHHSRRTAAVLVEVSFLDRADEEERLLRDSYKDEIAIGVVAGIESYLGVRTEVETAMEAVEREFEDAVALEAATSGKSVAEMVGGSEAPERAIEPPAKRGYALPEEPAEATPEQQYEAGQAGGRGVLKRMMAESVLAEADKRAGALEDDVEEFSTVQIGEAPDFSGASSLAEAEAMVEGIVAGPEADDFDFPAFKAFIEGLGLSHFSPTEFLFLGASNQSGRCAGRNSLPPRALWSNVTNTALMLDRIRAELGGRVHILSCYRSQPYNVCVGGVGESTHMRFNAIDWRCDTGTVTQWRAVARQVRASERRFRGGIGFYPSKGFIHIDTRGRDREW